MTKIKEKLIEKINAQEDLELLKDILELFERNEKKSIEFSKEQEERIRLSELDYQKGNTVSNEAIQKRLDEWLGK